MAKSRYRATCDWIIIQRIPKKTSLVLVGDNDRAKYEPYATVVDTGPDVVTVKVGAKVCPTGEPRTMFRLVEDPAFAAVREADVVCWIDTSIPVRDGATHDVEEQIANEQLRASLGVA